MNNELAQWAIFHRLYISKYNRFLYLAPIIFHSILDGFDIPYIKAPRKKSTRKNCVIFELPDYLQRDEFITKSDEPLIRSNKNSILAVLYKINTLYDGQIYRGLTIDEANLLSEWLGLNSIGQLVPIQLDYSISIDTDTEYENNYR